MANCHEQKAEKHKTRIAQQVLALVCGGGSTAGMAVAAVNPFASAAQVCTKDTERDADTGSRP
eukprot:5033656-Amphidinium_carterae.1